MKLVFATIAAVALAAALLGSGAAFAGHPRGSQSYFHCGPTQYDSSGAAVPRDCY